MSILRVLISDGKHRNTRLNAPRSIIPTEPQRAFHELAEQPQLSLSRETQPHVSGANQGILAAVTPLSTPTRLNPGNATPGDRQPQGTPQPAPAREPAQAPVIESAAPGTHEQAHIDAACVLAMMPADMLANTFAGVTANMSSDISPRPWPAPRPAGTSGPPYTDRGEWRRGRLPHHY